MARERKSKIIGTGAEGASIELEVQQLPAMRSVRLLHRLTRALGPASAAAAKGSGKGGKMSLGDLDVGNLSDAATLFFDKFSEQDLEEVTRLLLEESLTDVQGKKLPTLSVLDQVYGGRPDLLLKAVAFALEVNFETLFAAARGLMGQRSVAVSPSTSPTASPKSGPASD